MEFFLVGCTAAVAVAQWLVPSAIKGLLSGLLLGLVILMVVAMQQSLGSLNEAHAEQLESERRYRALFDACSDAILVYRLEDDGRQGALVEVNEAACHSLGYSRSQLLAMTAEDVQAPEARRHAQERAQALSEASILVFETVHVTSDRRRLPVEVSARLVQIGGHKLCLTVSHSIAAHKEVEGFLRGLTDLDELTGLLNRRGFFAQVERVRRQAKRMHTQVLLVYLDVDGLKRVNDDMGHAAGDALLVAAADALRLAFREEDIVARLGGDEFVAMASLGRRDDERLDCQAIAARLDEAVRVKRAELGDAYDFSVSSGSVVANSDELNDIDELLARTDQRMYQAKRARRRQAAKADVTTRST